MYKYQPSSDRNRGDFKENISMSHHTQYPVISIELFASLLWKITIYCAHEHTCA